MAMAVNAQRGNLSGKPISPQASAAATVAAGGRPTKLFIGGVSRHTTTKQLRDHFSQHGRVLDCVAMRQPDGRSRGFGYVTLDSPAAAERCLMEPQVIDGRVVDMKLAVPEGSAGAKTSIFMDFDDAFEYGDAVGSAVVNAAGGGLYCGSTRTSANSPWWTGCSYVNPAPLDCLDLLVRDEAPLDMLSMLSTNPAASKAPFCSTISAGAPIEATATTPSSQGMMSASAPCFVPKEERADAPDPLALLVSEGAFAKENELTVPAKMHPARTPLGELTNLVESDRSKDMIMPEAKKKKAPLGASFLSTSPTTSFGLTRMVPPPLDIDVAVDPELLDEPREEDAKALAEPTSVSTSEPQPDEKDHELSSDDDEEDDDDEYDRIPYQAEAGILQKDLPSLGSALHATGECRRCNFFPKGRCQNGTECIFCHLPHEKRKPSRQEKRERKAAWAQQHQEEEEDDTHEVGVAHQEDFRCEQPPSYQLAAAAGDEELCPATSSFLGLPPVLASTLSTTTASMHAPGDLTSLSPPGLSAPAAAAGMCCYGLVVGCGASFGAEDSPTCCLPPVLATTPPSMAYPMALPSMSWPTSPTGVLATTPTEASTAVKHQQQQQRLATSDESSRPDDAGHNNCWSRNELLSIRGAMEAAGKLKQAAASEEGASCVMAGCRAERLAATTS